ncbi:hypothetical protein PROFUN_01637 [Planoprotostelium fungivorum]|uniref:Uncharacterized protein n=1 Tax=Planoprotostelium fungivorum TaxID=1890364 RepID=A0A2P6NTS2_9EUKA|nr:hypothetical protein PROFUN_01637 [Planoprotostelium fungivorum]
MSTSHTPKPFFRQPGMHQLLSTSKFILPGLLTTASVQIPLSTIQNYKTANQLGEMTTRGKFPATLGWRTATIQSLMNTTVRWIFNWLDSFAFYKGMIIPYPLQGLLGSAIASAAVWRLDHLRTLQGWAVYGGTEAKPRFSDVPIGVYRGVWMGITYGLLHHLTQRGLEHLFVTSYATWTELLGRTLAVATAKILLSPLEIAIKKTQLENCQDSPLVRKEGLFGALRRLWLEKGADGLYAGWFLAIPEAFVSVFVVTTLFRMSKKFIE